MNKFYPPHSSLKPGARVIAYLRDSGGTYQEDSVERQEEELRRWCKQYGLILTEVYTDEARSAFKKHHKRKGLYSMMDYIHRGADEQAVIIWNYERIARNIKRGRAFIADIEAHDMHVCSLTDNLSEGPVRYIEQDLKLWSAEQASVKNSIDTSSALRRMVETTGGMPGTPPRGFKRGEPIHIGTHRNGEPRIVHRWEPDPGLAPMVKLAFEMRARGATLSQIMDATKIHKTINSYTTFFSNRLYMGVLEFGDLVIPNYCDPIISAELWEQVQKIGQARKQISAEHNPRRFSSTFLLSGMIYCQHCGSPMNAHIIAKKDKPLREYYSCMRKARRRECASREVPRLAVEEKVIQKLEDLALDLETLINFQRRVEEHHKRMSDKTEGIRVKLRRDIRDNDKRISNLTNAIAERGHTRALLDTLHQAELNRATLQNKLEDLENQINPLHIQTPIQLAALANELKDALHGEDIHKKKYALHMLATRILVSRRDGHVEVVLSYVPNVYVGNSAPAQVLAEHIQFEIPIPKYTKRPALT